MKRNSRLGIGLFLLFAACTPSSIQKPAVSSNELPFAQRYPASSKMQNELQLLRSRGRLPIENEMLLQKIVFTSSTYLKMPPALLWCLLFQESRLNHLHGFGAEVSVHGLGQFSRFSFFEVNNELTHFTGENLKMMVAVLGKDVRPIQAETATDASSYYQIPTAVVASASYLNNRYVHLQKILERDGLKYDPELLWFFAAMAYNKGGRSVLSLWNLARKSGGKVALEQLLSDPLLFFQVTRNSAQLTQALSRIWPEDTAQRFAYELRIHMNNLKSCALINTSKGQEVKHE